MSDSQQPEHMRPIPDGGLKDAMPNWLKRPPAWRGVPTSAERHERTLPEPDTSEIDPRTLLEVGDLPQWLQTIAARGDVPVPEPDASTSHAVAQIQAASTPAKPSIADEVDVADPPAESSPPDAAAETAAEQASDVVPAVEHVADVASSGDVSVVESTTTSRSPWIIPAIALILLAVLVMIVVIF